MEAKVQEKRPSIIVEISTFLGSLYWCARRESNLRPFGPEPNALSSELLAHADRSRSDKKYYITVRKDCKTFPYFRKIGLVQAFLPLASFTTARI